MQLFQKLSKTPLVGVIVWYAAFSKINYNAVSWSESLVCSFLQILVLRGGRKAARLLNWRLRDQDIVFAREL
jgi:hypothetical protein